MVGVCGYELPTNLQSENIPKSFRWATFSETPCMSIYSLGGSTCIVLNFTAVNVDTAAG